MPRTIIATYCRSVQERVPDHDAGTHGLRRDACHKPMIGLLDYLMGPRILLYHSVADGARDPTAVAVEAFKEQLSWLAKSGFEFVSLCNLMSSIQARDFKALRNKVVLTFDDGYADFAANALPVLQCHRASATVFLVTELLGGTASWSSAVNGVPLLSRQEARHIKKQGMSLGSHTTTHPDLTGLDPKELRRELLGSRQVLSELGESFSALAYPWGRWSGAVVECVKACGYECAVIAGGRMDYRAANPYLLPRITISNDLDLDSFRSLLRPNLPDTLGKCVRALRRVLSRNWSFG